jgi:multicomponent Na+:H+ antiporter subunit D
MPWTMAAFAIAAASLIGIPGTAGFISKWYLVSAAIEQQAWAAVAVILIGSLLAVIYVWKLVEVLYFQPADTSTGQEGFGKAPPHVREAPLSLLLPTWVLVVANIFFGLNTDLTVGVATRAVQMLGLGAT